MTRDWEEQEWKVKSREDKVNKKRNRMKVNGRGLKSVILPVLEKKSKSKSDFKNRRVTERSREKLSFNYT